MGTDKIYESQVIEKHSKTGTQLVEVGTDVAGQRVDNFLISYLKGVPKSHIYRLVRTGQVRVNKGRVKVQYRLRPGDLIRVPPVVWSPSSLGPEDALETRAMGRRLEKQVIYEDAWLLVINKPAGMPVHGGSGLSGGVIESLRLIRPEAKEWELVHRLDKDTSGCLLIAKRKSVLRTLHQEFREDQVDKRYLAMLAGIWEGQRQLVDLPLRKYVLRGGERLVQAHPQGKPARTEFIKRGQGSDATLVEARLLTGRTHQIRVHATWMGHPIVGDARYGDDEVNLRFRRRGLKRLFLHAWRLAFAHPVSGVLVSLEAPLERGLVNWLKREGYWK
ncbi:MAG: RluA family pseudouridine synthase [Methylohalobius sp.]|nr:RluA family pseudouridine synthase [Methylohalobius sp.]